MVKYSSSLGGNIVSLNAYAVWHFDWSKISNVDFIFHKSEIDKVLNYLIYLLEKCRVSGVSEFKEEIARLDDDFVKLGLLLLYDGRETETIFKVLFNLINSTNLDDIGYLTKILQLEAFLMIQKGFTKFEFLMILNSYLGVKSIKNILEFYEL